MDAQAASKRYQASYIGPDRERHKAPSTPAERPEVEGLVDGVWYPRRWSHPVMPRAATCVLDALVGDE